MTQTTLRTADRADVPAIVALLRQDSRGQVESARVISDLRRTGIDRMMM